MVIGVDNAVVYLGPINARQTYKLLTISIKQTHPPRSYYIVCERESWALVIVLIAFDLWIIAESCFTRPATLISANHRSFIFNWQREILSFFSWLQKEKSFAFFDFTPEGIISNYFGIKHKKNHT